MTMTSSVGSRSRQFDDERATMAAEKELTIDIYGGSPPPGLSPRDDVSVPAPSTTANGVDSHGAAPTPITNGDAPTGGGRRRNGFLPSGMSRGSGSSGRSDQYSGKKQRLGRMTPIWRRIINRSNQAVANDREATYSNAQTTANGVKTSRSYQLATTTDNSRTTSTADSRSGAGLNGQTLAADGEARRSVSGGQEQQPHLNVILGAPAGFRDSSFDESDPVSKPTTADGRLRLPRISTNADGSPSESYSTSFSEAKKRPAPPAPPVKPLVSPPQLSVKDYFHYQKRPAPEVPLSSRAVQSAATNLPDTRQSSSNTDVADKPAADVGKLVIPEVFRQSRNQSNPDNFRSSSRRDVGSGGSIFRRSSFLQHLENVVGRHTPSSSAVSTIARGARRSDNVMHNSSMPEDLNQSSGSLVSQLFHSALSSHDDNNGGAGKKFKFLVPGIDVPAESAEQQHPENADDDGTVPSSRVRKGGFSYLSDVNVAAEVTRRAADMTAKRQHESVEESLRDRVDGQAGPDEDEATLRAARARLHAPQPRLDLPPAAVQSPADTGGRQQMLLDIVDAARKRARKNGLDSAEYDDYLQEVDTNQNQPDSQTQNLSRAGKRQRNGTDELRSWPNSEPGTLRDVSESNDLITRENGPEVPRDVSHTSGLFDNGQTSGRHELEAPDFYRGPTAANFRSADANRRVEGVTSYRAARQALRSDIDRRLNADRLAGDEVVANAAGGRVRNGSYLPAVSAASVAGRRADDAGSLETRHDDIRLRRRSAASTSSSSDDDEPDSWWISDGEDGAGGYTVSIVGGQVHARRLPRQRSAARNHRRRSSLRRRPHVRQRPVSVAVWSSADDGESTTRKGGRPIRRHFVADRRPLPLTVDTDDITARRPYGFIGHVYNANITQSTESIQRRVTAAESSRDIFHYFSDPETQLGPYRTGAYVSHSDAYSPASLDLLAPEFYAIRSGTQTFSAVPIQSVYVPAGKPAGVETMTAVDPQLRDVGTKNRRYFVQMLLNATRGRREVLGVSSTGNSGGGSNGGGGMMTRGWYGSAPQLLQLSDDVTDQYTGARRPQRYGELFTAAMHQPNARHTSVYDVTSPADHAGASSHVARRPQSTLPPTSSGHVRRSVVALRSPAAAVGVVTAERRRRPAAQGDVVNRSTVEFDIELEPAAGRTRRHVDMDDGHRLLSSVHANAGHRSTSSQLPRYAIQLNETMRFDIDSPSSDQRTTTSNPPPPTYDRVRQRRRQRPSLEGQTERGRTTVVDVRPAAQHRTARQRRQVPLAYDDDEVDDDAGSSHVNDDDDEVYSRRAATTDGQPPAGDSDLPRVVRGSILIRNSIDTAGTPRHIDVVTTGDSDASGASDALVVEDNTNMFDGLYRQSRENPIYLSDPEQSPDDDVNSRPHTSTRSAQNRHHQKGRTKNKTSIVDDFDKNVNISRGKQN